MTARSPGHRPQALVLYQFMRPDDVVSARHFDDLCDGLVARGFDVIAVPSNRSCRDRRVSYPAREEWNGLSIRRTWRPPLDQASSIGRIVNALWMTAAWSLRALLPSSGDVEVIVVGTDPILGIACALPWKIIRPSVRIAHWCFDLQPDAAVADGLLAARGLPHRLLAGLHGMALRRCDLVADLGACMRERLAVYSPRGRSITLPPWALVEPEAPAPQDEATRQELFGDARLGLLYSGNFGRAHSCDEFLALARRLSDAPIAFNFAVRGNAADSLRASLRAVNGNGNGNASVNVRMAGFAPEAELEKRLGAADVHLVSLRSAWTGVVVPSKFFGALAAGRPVLFAGSPQSGIARWIQEFGIGWVLDESTASDVEARLRELARDPAALESLRQRCFETYRDSFAREKLLDAWASELRELLLRPDPPQPGVPPAR